MRRSTILMACALAVFAGNAVCGQKSVKECLSGLPFAMSEITEPVFPSNTVSILAHGAVADGRTLNTKAINDAIDACAQSGGGTVVVPSGTWLTGSIQLKSNINLHLDRGALLQMSPRFEDYQLISGFDGKSKKFMLMPPVFGFRLKNIAITGEGMIDGAGEAWRPVKKEKQTASQWKKLIASGGVLSDDGKMWWPSQAAAEGADLLEALDKDKSRRTKEGYSKAREFLRPNMVQLVQCDGILIDGPTFRNSPRFHLYPFQSENIIIRNVTVSCPWWAQNGDGIDFNSCRNVLLYNSTVDAGDDAICVKPGKIAEWQQPGPSCENIVILDCVVYHGHGGIVIGSESKGGARNIFAQNCILNGTDVGLRFKSGRGRGGLVEGVTVRDINMRDIMNEAILFDMYYEEGTPEEKATVDVHAKSVEAVNDITPRFQNFSISNIVCNGASRAILFNGLPEMPVKRISIDSVTIAATKGVLCVDADSVSIRHASFSISSGPVLSVNQSTNLTFDSIGYTKGAETFLRVDGTRTAGIHLVNTDASLAGKKFEFAPAANKSAVVEN